MRTIKIILMASGLVFLAGARECDLDTVRMVQQ